jgi:hypothetical protein
VLRKVTQYCQVILETPRAVHSSTCICGFRVMDQAISEASRHAALHTTPQASDDLLQRFEALYYCTLCDQGEGTVVLTPLSACTSSSTLPSKGISTLLITNRCIALLSTMCISGHYPRLQVVGYSGNRGRAPRRKTPRSLAVPLFDRSCQPGCSPSLSHSTAMGSSIFWIRDRC